MIDDAADPQLRTERFRPSAGERWGLAFCTALIGFLAAFNVAIALAMLVPAPLLAVALILAGLVIAALAVRVAGETAAAFRLSIAIDAGTARLRLPRRRGHILLAAIDETVPLASVESVETRAESFRQLGVVAIQEAYRLVLTDGRSIDLGADRQMKPKLFGAAAAAIAARRNLAIRNLGMVDAAPGFLAVYGTSAPPWSAPSMTEAEIGARVTASARAFKLIAASATLVAIARLIARR